ncbi:hypothetical protein R3P38DRAFT_3183759 [Favolaschia claudopus]|uniref:Uncharacterized protein n=1 Tax=Favolaschia claudopus TaxID=2862362 RepID=A0AAW0CAN0_9AGAR
MNDEVRPHILAGLLKFYRSKEWNLACAPPIPRWQCKNGLYKALAIAAKGGTTPIRFCIFGMVEATPQGLENVLLLKRPDWESRRPAERDFLCQYDMQLVTLSLMLETHSCRRVLLPGDCLYLESDRTFPPGTIVFVRALLSLYQQAEPAGRLQDYKLEVVQVDSTYVEAE